MRVKQDIYYEDLSELQLAAEYKRINEPFNPKSSKRSIIAELKRYHRQRSFVCWHDTSTISNASHLLIMLGVLYDPAVFYTDDEYFDVSGGFNFSHIYFLNFPSSPVFLNANNKSISVLLFLFLFSH